MVGEPGGLAVGWLRTPGDGSVLGLRVAALGRGRGRVAVALVALVVLGHLTAGFSAVWVGDHFFFSEI